MLANFDYNNGKFTLIDNTFITSYVTTACGDAVRVYLYGLYQASNGGSAENTAEGFSLALNLPESKILEHFLFWHDKGLVNVKSKQPLEVTYLPLRGAARAAVRKFSPAKYADFNKAAQQIFEARMLLPSELSQYYELIEDTGITQEALLMIMAYSVSGKGQSVSANYVLTVARDWAAGGKLTAGMVEERLKQHEALTDGMRELFFVLGKTGRPDFEDRQTYLRWHKDRGFGHAEILYAAKLTKKKGGMARLEKVLEEFFKAGMFTLAEMEQYTAEKDRRFKLTIEIARRLTCYFQNLDYVIECYTAPWLALGFSEEQLLEAAAVCFKKNKRDFDAMDAYLKKSAGQLQAANMTEEEFEAMLLKKTEETLKKARGQA